MSLIEGFLEVQKYDFSDTSFNLLMQNRIHKVLRCVYAGGGWTY